MPTKRFRRTRSDDFDLPRRRPTARQVVEAIAEAFPTWARNVRTKDLGERGVLVEFAPFGKKR